jgi:hypothetical protein
MTFAAGIRPAWREALQDNGTKKMRSRDSVDVGETTGRACRDFQCC